MHTWFNFIFYSNELPNVFELFFGEALTSVWFRFLNIKNDRLSWTEVFGTCLIENITYPSPTSHH